MVCVVLNCLYSITYNFIENMCLLCTEISEGSLTLMINAIVSKLRIDIDNDRKLKLIGALKQLSVNPNSTGESLSIEYLTMISNEDELKQEESLRPSRMQRLQGMENKERKLIDLIRYLFIYLFIIYFQLLCWLCLMIGISYEV